MAALRGRGIEVATGTMVDYPIAKADIVGAARDASLDPTVQDALNKLPDRDAPIIVYCAAGNRSAYAAKTLTDLGYTDVWTGESNGADGLTPLILAAAWEPRSSMMPSASPTSIKA